MTEEWVLFVNTCMYIRYFDHCFDPCFLSFVRKKEKKVKQIHYMTLYINRLTTHSLRL